MRLKDLGVDADLGCVRQEARCGPRPWRVWGRLARLFHGELSRELSLPAIAYGIRYDLRAVRQVIVDGAQA